LVTGVWLLIGGTFVKTLYELTSNGGISLFVSLFSLLVTLLALYVTQREGVRQAKIMNASRRAQTSRVLEPKADENGDLTLNTWRPGTSDQLAFGESLAVRVEHSPV
jgi:hypothetical protein